MKRILALLVLLCASATAQVKIYSTFYRNNYTAVTTDTGISAIGSGTNYYRITWNAINAPATCTFTVDTSANNSTWTTGGILGATTCTTTGNSAVVAATTNYFRVVVSAISGAGAAVTVAVQGYSANPAGNNGSILTFYCTTTVNATSLSNQYLVPGANGAACATGSEFAQPVPFAGTVVAMNASLGTACTTGLIITLRKNGANTTMTCNPLLTTACSDVTHTQAFAIGDKISVQISPQQATETCKDAHVSLQYQ